jgi:hypothetical protein
MHRHVATIHTEKELERRRAKSGLDPRPLHILAEDHVNKTTIITNAALIARAEASSALPEKPLIPISVKSGNS